jgi:hypothetical protein
MLSVADMQMPGTYPRFIYHYTSTITAIEHILQSRSLLFNALSKTHDPLEFQDYKAANPPDRVVSDDYAEEQKHLVSELNRVFKKHTKIACFSSDNPNDESVWGKGYCRPRMWSQYADGHSGVCLAFDRDNLSKFIHSGLDKTGTTIRCDAGYIDYNNTLSELSDALSENPAILKEISLMELIESNLKAFLFLKLEDYRDEQEYRMCLYSSTFDDKEGLSIGYGDSLKAIILGCRFPAQYVINMHYYMKEQNIALFQLLWENGVPNLVRIPIGQ